MRIIVAVTFSFLLGACALLKGPTMVSLKPMTSNELLEKPFGHTESISEFDQNLPERTKIQKLIKRSPRSNHRPDTIYNFLYKKSKISIYKTQFKQEFLLGGSILNPEIELANGIRQGMEKEKFFQSFSDLEVSSNDTIVLKHPRIERTFNFYFNERGRLERFTFTGHNPDFQNQDPWQ